MFKSNVGTTLIVAPLVTAYVFLSVMANALFKQLFYTHFEEASVIQYYNLHFKSKLNKLT